MKEVTAAEFWARINPLDVHPRPVGPWPYTSRFELRNRTLVGEIRQHIPKGEGLPVPSYFLAEV